MLSSGYYMSDGVMKQVSSTPTYGMAGPPVDWHYLVSGMSHGPPYTQQSAVGSYGYPQMSSGLPSSTFSNGRLSRALPMPYHPSFSAGADYYGYSAANDSADAYSCHTPQQQSYSNGDTSSGMAVYSGPDGGRSWPVTLSATRGASHALDSELKQPHFPQSTSNAFGSMTTITSAAPDNQVFTGLNSLAGSLPGSSTMMGERILPNPRLNMILPSSSDVGHTSPHSYYPDSKTQAPWSATDRGCSSTAASASTITTAKSSSSPSTAPSDIHSCAFAPSTQSAKSSPTGSLPTASAAGGFDHGHGIHASAPTATSYPHALNIRPQPSPVASASSANSTYSYGRGGKRGAQPSGEGTLLNDEPYMHLAHRSGPQAQGAIACHGLPMLQAGRSSDVTDMARRPSATRGTATIR